MKRFLLVSASLIVLAAALASYLVLWAPNSFKGDRFVIVSRGETFSQVTDSLEKAGILRSRLLFSAAGRFRGLTTKMQIGKYRFKPGVSNTDILENLRYGMTLEAITITIPEGLRATRQAHFFARGLGIDSVRYMTLVHDSVFVRSFGVAAPSLEGYLMPNTYQFYWQADEADIIAEMVREFRKAVSDSLLGAASRDGTSLDEVLTLASIIEAETSVDSERTIVAGVYHNRLLKRMRLEADPTIQYILPDGPRRLYFSDLQRESPYNTYRHYGLPPGPINNPGLASITAALFPRKHKFLFFVATGGGGHTFSRTFTEHLKAIQSFRKRRAEQQVASGEGVPR
jgi:UPF0755 protein